MSSRNADRSVDGQADVGTMDPPNGDASTRERLLAATALLLAESGFEGTRLADVARRASVTTGAIYSNFRGKSELMRAVIDRLHITSLPDLVRSPHHGSAADVIVAAGASFTDPDGSQRRRAFLEAVLAARMSPDLIELVREQFAARETSVKQLLAEGVEEGSLDESVDPDAFARFCVALSLGWAVCESIFEAMPEQAAWDEVARRVVEGFRPSSSS
jgi:AcrR family transcriptional regulator